jgi:hypothetical protein
MGRWKTLRVLPLLGFPPPVEYRGDGCTGSPDSLFGITIREACRWHDWAYFLRREHGISSRFMADFWFHRNVFRLCREQGAGVIVAWFVAVPYLLGVRLGYWIYRPFRALKRRLM